MGKVNKHCMSFNQWLNSNHKITSKQYDALVGDEKTKLREQYSIYIGD